MNANDHFLHEKNIEALIKRKDYSEAERILQQKIYKNPKSADSFYLLGVSYYMQGKISLAIEKLKKALSLDSTHTDALICLSVLYNDLGKYDEAKKIFESANSSVTQKSSKVTSGVDKKFSVKHLELADLYFRYRRFEEAIEEYSKSFELDPLNVEIKSKRAKCYAKLGYITRAIQELNEALQDDPKNVKIRLQTGLLHFSQGNILDAELEWEKVLELDSKNKDAKTYLELAKENRLNPQSHLD